MKVKNKETGGLANLIVDKDLLRVKTDAGWADYSSLTDLLNEWEDYEETKEYWCITGRGNLHFLEDNNDDGDKQRKEIGNYFETREEAEKEVEKLKALTEAKEDGLKIKGYYYNHEDLVILADIGKCNKLTLDTLFGKEID